MSSTLSTSGRRGAQTISLLVPALIFAACDAPLAATEMHATAERLVVPANVYYGVAWIERDAIAFAVSGADDESRIDILSRDGKLLRSFEPSPRQDCVHRTFRGLGRLPTGEVGAADVCTTDNPFEPPETANLIAVDVASLEVRDLGPTTEPPSWVAWRSDMKAVTYSVGDDLCAVLRERKDRDQPLEQTVTVRGSTFEVGIDLTTDSDGCPDIGRASYPAYARDDRLAFMASADSGRDGQDLIDLPWAMFVLAPGADPLQILDGVRSPRGLGWLSEDRLIFSGALGGMPGIWSIRPDGTGLVRVADEEASWLAPSPDSHDLVAIREHLMADAWTTSVVLYDLRTIDVDPH